MPKLHANGIEIEYEIHGDGKPLVLIAGLGYSRWCWHRVIPDLAKKYKVISFDNRGVGGTTRTEGPYSAELLAEDTAALLDALNIKKATICGISMGGFITQALYLKRPDLFEKMILMSTGFGGPRQASPSPEMITKLKDTTLDVRARALLSVAPDFAEKNKEFLDHWMQERARNPIHPEGYKSQLAIGLKLINEENSFEAGLRHVSVPSFILFGELDPLIPATNATLLEKAIPGSRSVILPKIGHFLPFEHPEGVVRELFQFMNTDRIYENSLALS